MNKIQPNQTSTVKLRGEGTGDYAVADWEKALEFKRKMGVHDANGDDYALSVPIDEFKRFGEGVKLFFEFIKLTAIVFWIMTLMSIPAIYSNYTGDGLSLNF